MPAISATRQRTRSSKQFWTAPAILVIAALMLFGLSLWSLRGELISYVDTEGSDAALFDRLRQSPPLLPISLSSTETILMRCESLLTSAIGAQYPEAERIFVALHCLEFSRRSVEAMPSYAYGWYSVALFSFALADENAGLIALENSQLDARNEQWLAERRVQLAETYLNLLDDQTMAGHERDLILLAQSNRGIRSIARRYIENADFRERITTLVETLPMSDQARFIATVRAAARQAQLSALPT